MGYKPLLDMGDLADGQRLHDALVLAMDALEPDPAEQMRASVAFSEWIRDHFPDLIRQAGYALTISLEEFQQRFKERGA
jgi:hypothetical protein